LLSDKKKTVNSPGYIHSGRGVPSERVAVFRIFILLADTGARVDGT